MKVDFIYFVGNDWTQNCSSTALKHFCDIYTAAHGEVGDLWWSDNQKEKSAWSIHSIPTLVFAVPTQNGNIALAKLVGNQITQVNVNKMMQALVKLIPNPQGTSFYNPEQPSWVQIGVTENEEAAPAGGNLLSLGKNDEINLDFDAGMWWKNPWNLLLLAGGFLAYRYGSKNKWW